MAKYDIQLTVKITETPRRKFFGKLNPVFKFCRSNSKIAELDATKINDSDVTEMRELYSGENIKAIGTKNPVAVNASIKISVMFIFIDVRRAK